MVVSKRVLNAQILGQNDGSSRRRRTNLMESERELQGGQRQHRLKGVGSSPKVVGTFHVPFTKNQSKRASADGTTERACYFGRTCLSQSFDNGAIGNANQEPASERAEETAQCDRQCDPMPLTEIAQSRWRDGSWRDKNGCRTRLDRMSVFPTSDGFPPLIRPIGLVDLSNQLSHRHSTQQRYVG